MKILPVVAEMLHADGKTDEQTDLTKLRIAFRKKRGGDTKTGK